MPAHEFHVRRGSQNLTQVEWASVNEEIRTWYPECRLELDVQGEMGPFGIRVATAITVTLSGGPDSRSAAASLLRHAIERVGRPDLLDLEAKDT